MKHAEDQETTQTIELKVLQVKLDKLRAEREQLRATLNATSGAITVVEQLIEGE